MRYHLHHYGSAILSHNITFQVTSLIKVLVTSLKGIIRKKRKFTTRLLTNVDEEVLDVLGVLVVKQPCGKLQYN